MKLFDFLKPTIIISNDQDSMAFKKILDKNSVDYLITITPNGWHIKIRGQRK